MCKCLRYKDEGLRLKQERCSVKLWGRAMRHDETYRECPSCGARVLGGGPRQRTLTCPDCFPAPCKREVFFLD